MAETQVSAGSEQNKYYPYQGLFYVNRHHFWQAGQDSWTLPPAQDQDMFLALTNVEPVLQGILQRRRGYSLFSSQAPVTPYTLGYSFRSEILGLREVVWTSPSTPTTAGNVLVTTEAGQTLIPSLFTPLANSFKPRMVLSRDYGYFADGILADYKKFDGTQSATNLTKWGINVNDIGALVFGPNDATVAADQGSSGTSGSQGPNGGSSASGLTNAPNVFVSDGVYATASMLANTTRTLQVTGFNFNSVPVGATIDGIRAAVQHNSNNGVLADSSVQLIKGGFPGGTNKATGVLWSALSEEYFTYGGASDLWGQTWTQTDISANNFGLQLVIRNTDNTQSDIAQVDFVSLTVYWHIAAAGTSWTNPNGSFSNNPVTPATAVATVTPTSGLRDTGFGFAVSGNSIVGIQVTITCKVSGGSVNLSPQMVKAGAVTGTSKVQAVTSTGYTAITFGGPTDLWNAAWLAADVNGATFGVQYVVSTLSGSATFSVDRVRITIYTIAGPLTLGVKAGGAITLLNGRTYFYAFQNSKTGHTSGLSPASVTTGPMTNQQQPLSGIPTSTDPQVDTVALLATADGNDQTTLYLLVTLPNGTATYTDNVPDATLLTQALYLNTDANGVIHGVANNNPPPVINFPTKHKGRLYGAIGRALFFSKNLDEVTTANGLITSKWEEAWPASNQFDISESAETIIGLMSDGETLWIGTERGIRRLIGDSPFNFQKPEVQFNEAGLLNQDCWKVTFYEGQPVGTIWMTPDFRLMASDFNTYQDIGTPIQNILNSINTTAVSSIHASFVSMGPADYYMLYVPTGSNASPDTICVLNLRSKKWFIWQPTDLVTASLFFLDGSGLPRWLFASQAGSLYEWLSTTLQDRTNNGPVSYPVTIQTSWLDFGDYTLRKIVNQIIPSTADTLALTVQVDAASNQVDFSAPLSVVSATTVIPASIPNDVFVPLASGPSHNRYFRFTFVSPASTIQNVLTSFNIESGVVHRY